MPGQGSQQSSAVVMPSRRSRLSCTPSTSWSSCSRALSVLTRSPIPCLSQYGSSYDLDHRLWPMNGRFNVKWICRVYAVHINPALRHATTGPSWVAAFGAT